MTNSSSFAHKSRARKPHFARRRYLRPAFERLELRQMLAFTVTSAEVFSTPVLRVVVDFNQIVSGASVAASDLRINSTLSATSVTPIDADTYEFVLPTLSAGTNTLSFNAGSITDSGAVGLDFFTKSIAVASASQYTVKQNPRIQQGNAPLIGYAGSDKDQFDILWQTIPTPGSSGTQDTFAVQYRLAGSAGAWTNATSLNAPISTGVQGRIVHSATIKGLNWNTDYEYRVRQLQGDVIVTTFQNVYHTRLQAGDETPFSFAAYGDSATDVATNFGKVQARINAIDPLFSVLLGDNVYEAGSHTEADSRFEAAKNPEAATWMASHIDYLGLGNHDMGTQQGVPSQQLYSVPVPVAGVTAPAAPPFNDAVSSASYFKSEFSYSFDYGDVHFVTFDTNALNNASALNGLLTWVVADLNASQARWKIVYGHHPVAGTPDKGESAADNYYQQVVSRLGAAGVDLFMSGHSHTYGWSYPLTGQENNVATYVDRGEYNYFYHEDGLPQLVSGMGGRDLRSGTFTGFPFVAKGFSTSTPVSSEFGFSLIDVTQDTLTVKYIAADDGAIIDQFVITKDSPDAVPTQTVTIQQNTNGYAGTLDTYVHQNTPTQNFNSATNLLIDLQDPDASANRVQSLLRFQNIFGTGDGQIPTNAAIRSAVLQLNVTDAGSNVNFHRMASSWDPATATWNSLGTGIQLNGTEALAAIDASTGLTSNAGRLDVDVLASLQAWQANPSSNFGWALMPTGIDSTQFSSSTGATAPKLIVTYYVDTVTPAPPVARPDNVVTNPNAPVTIFPLTNDYDVNGETLNYVAASTTTPAHGSIEIRPDKSIIYTPNPNYVGLDTFTYTITDGTFTSSALVTVEVAMPTVTMVFMQGCEGCSLACGCGYRGTVDAYLRNNAGETGTSFNTQTPLFIDSDGPTAHALLRFEDLFGAAGYTIPAGTTIKSATLELQVSSTANATGNGIAVHRMLQDWGDAPTWDSMVNGIQTNGIEAVASADDSKTAPSVSLLSFNVLSSLLAWQADPSKNFGWALMPLGSDGVQIDSSEGAMAPKLTIKLYANGQVPPGAQSDHATTLRNQSVTVDVLANDLDFNSDPLYVSMVASPAHGTVVLNANNTITYLPALNYFGDDTFEYTVSDGQGGNSVATVHIEIPAPVTSFTFQNGVNGYAATVDTWLSEAAPTTTTNGASNLFKVDNDEPSGTGSDAQGLLRFDNLFGSGAGQIPANATIVSATVELSVPTNNSQNPLNIHRMKTAWTTNSSWDALVGGVQANDVEAVATADLTATPNVTTPGIFSFDATTSLQAWFSSATPNAANQGWVFLPTGSDGVEFASAEGTIKPKLIVNFTVPAAPPVAVNDTASTPRNTAAVIAVLTNDTDVNGDVLTVASVSTPAHGTATRNANNTITYLPLANYVGTDSFTYSVTDGTSSVTATVNVTVTQPTNTLTFQQGFNGYNGTVDTNVSDANAGTAQAGNQTVLIDGAAPISHGLLRFDGLFGAGAIPAGSTITSAILTVLITDLGDNINFHRMLKPFSATSTYNSTGGTGDSNFSAPNGVQANGVEALATIDGVLLAPSLAVATVNLTTSLQAWSNNPASNLGWVLLNTSSGGVQFPSSEYTPTPANRPKLTVTYILPPENFPPVTVNDTATTNTNAQVIVPVLANDSDYNGDTLSVSAVTQPSHGTATINLDKTVTYIPANGYFGTDSFTYTASDGQGGTTVGTVNITINHVNSAPTAILLTGSTVAENALGATIGALGATDADVGDTHTFSTTDPRFEIIGNQLKLKSNQSLDFEAGSTVSVSVKVVDSGTPGLEFTQSVIVNVTNVNEAPTAVNLSNTSVAENAAGATIGNVSVVDADGVAPYSFVLSDSRFEIDLGVLKLKPGITLDYETAATIALTITARDAGGLSKDQAFSISVTNVNEAPTAVNLSSNTVPENAEAAVIGTVSIVDADGAAPYAFDLTDNRFEIVGNSLKLKSGVSLNYESESSILLSITATDAGGQSKLQAFNILVTNVNEGPSAINLSNLAVAENVAGAVIGTVAVVDPEGGPFTFGFSDNRFEVVGSSLKLKSTASLNYENETSIALTLTATDGGGLATSQLFAIAVSDVNEAPSAVNLSNLSVSENVPGAVVGDVSVVDSDAGDGFTLTVSDTRFELVGNQLRLKATESLNFEIVPSVALTITATDTAGLPKAQAFVIVVTNVNEAPTAIALNSSPVPENAAGVLVGMLSASDPDVGNGHAFSTADPRFVITGNELRLAPGQSLNYEQTQMVTLQVTATDTGSPPLGLTQTVTFSVSNVNEAPTNITLSRSKVFSGIASAWVAAVAVTDPDFGDVDTFAFSDSRFEVRNGDLFLKPGVQISAAETAINLSITATDSGTPGLSVQRSFVLTVEAPPAGWDFGYQWRPNSRDVNADGSIGPLDALLIYNLLNAVGFQTLPNAVGGTVAPNFYDTTGDGTVDPTDAVEVFNYLNAVGAGEAPESLPITLPKTSSPAVEPPIVALPVTTTAGASDSIAVTAVGNDDQPTSLQWAFDTATPSARFVSAPSSEQNWSSVWNDLGQESSPVAVLLLADGGEEWAMDGDGDEVALDDEFWETLLSQSWE